MWDRSRQRLGRYVAGGLVAGGAALLLWLAVAALGASGPAGEPRVTGTVSSVQARDIGHAESIVVRSADGREWRFKVADSVDMTPGHLREHATFGQPVNVYYRRDGADLVAIRITD